jgi:hypothetical protein
MRNPLLLFSSLVLLAVIVPLNLFAADSLGKNSRINPNDTYVTFDETTVRQAQFAPSDPQTAAPGAVAGKMRSSTVRQTTFHVEEGYDATGALVLDITFLGSAPTYTPALKEARFSAGAVELFDGNGAPIHFPSIEAQLASAIPALPGASLIKGPVTQDILAYAKAVSATVVGDMPPAEGPASVTLRMPRRGSSGAVFTKTFSRSSEGWVLAQIAFSHLVPNGSMSSVTSFSNMLWHQNVANDAARKATRVGSSTLMRRASSANTPRVARTKRRAKAPASCTTTVTHLGGSQNVVFQHGLEGSSCSWNDSTYSMTAALNGALSFGTEIVPTITSTEALATQTSSLVSQLQTTGGSHYVLIGHSQGGLISRSAAQYFQSNSPSTVSGVITVDTPNMGAPLIENGIGAASQLGNYLNFIVDDIDSAIYCYDEFGDYGPYCTVGCGDPNGGALLCGLLLAGTGDDNIINDAIDAAGIYVLNTAIPATIDLEPGSAFLNTLNSYPENFIRVGIVSDSSDIYGPFLPEQMGGDLVGGAAFGEDTVVALQAADLALNAGIDYLLADEDDYDCEDYPDQEECVNDDAYIYAYETIDNDLFVPDEYWDPLPLPNECCDFSDGIVNGQSQYYPPQSNVAQYVILGADTHLASTKSPIMASVLLTALERYFFVPAKGCAYTLSPTSVTEPASGGKGTFTVTTGSTCAWTVESSASWLTFTPANGTGSATITYTIAANTGGSRNGNLVVAGIATFSVTQNGTTPETLTVTVTGSGGTVTSSPTGIACPGACSAAFASGTKVTLTPAAALGYKFTGWSGACSGTGACVITMNSAESVTATFASEPAQKLTMTVSGGGTVTSSPSGISCPGTCSASFSYGTSVTLTASAGSGYTFSGWSGACSGAGTCTVVMGSAESVTATFVLHPTLTVTVSGSGTVTSSPSGISCPGTCSAAFTSGTKVTLTPAAALGYKFTGWSGACSGTGACTVTMNSAQSVTATFASEPAQTLTVTVSGSGTVKSSPAGISCPGTCSASFSYGTSVTLTATPSSGYTFSGWSGACSGSGNCMVVMNSAESVTATFSGGPPWTFSTGIPPNNNCSHPGTYSFTLNQQSNANSLSWSSSVTVNETFTVSFDWTLSDSKGTLLTDDYGSNYTGTRNYTAPRAPVGTPTLAINASIVQSLTGCDAEFQETLTGIN